MTDLGPALVALIAAGAIAVGGLFATGADGPRTALVIDAAAGADGRELVDSRLREVDAAIRLPRTSAEARTNLRYFAAQDYRVIVTGPRASAAAEATGVPVVRAADLAGALAAARR